MKIVRQSPDQLILQNVPWVMAICISASILGLAGASIAGFFSANYTFGTVMLLSTFFMGLFFALFVRRDDLILDRSRDLIEMRHASVFGRRKIKHALGHLSHALVQSQGTTTHASSRDGNPPTHRVALVLTGGMDAGTLPATEIYASGPGAEKAAAAINDWLAQDIDSRSA